ncbi:response regulator transcription factor [Qipengyuania sp. GH25]|uniref:Response regulator transcription factor n=1 Tax=Qipengyuania pacifica TaxID=2860199 RepID=A0ABS7JKB1_9SPHN|nr:response regulator transcription factor [Qipengyuania aerophila]MBX7489826.1 response regulator transcription factor [Qipengyuania aerophila]
MKIEENDEPLVFIVDDDETMRAAMAEMLETVSIPFLVFESGQEFLQADLPNRPGCVILDIRMPGLSGLDLQSELVSQRVPYPIIFITGHGDVPMTIQAMKAGAVDFLTKPVRSQALLDAVQSAIRLDVERWTAQRSERESSEIFGRLTRRERQVFSALARGLLNKQIAFELHINEATVKLHRGNLMKKTGVDSLADLIRLWDALPEALRTSVEM